MAHRPGYMKEWYAKHPGYHKRDYAKRREQKKEQTRKEYHERKAAGMCTASGCTTPPLPGKILCAVHRKRQADSAFRSKYKLTREQLVQLQAIQSCEVCGSEDALVIDHNHTTGRVRGVLCNKCNTALGFVGDSPGRLRTLAKYVEERDALENGG